MEEETHRFFRKQEESSPFFQSALGRYFQKIQGFFSREGGSRVSLLGRIREVEEECAELVENLNHLKTLASSKLEKQLSAQFCLVIDGTIKDLSRIQRESMRGQEMSKQARTGGRYQVWIEEAHTLLTFREYSPPKKVLRHVITYNINEFHLRVDRDLQLIEDYLNHAIVEASEEDVQQKEFNHKLVMEELEPLMVRMLGLKDVEDVGSIERMLEWKLLSDHLRAEHFSEALHIIDCVFHRTEFGNIALTLGAEKSIGKRIGLIEEHMEQIKEAAETLEEGEGDEEEDNPYSNLANQLEMEAREINLDPDIAPREKEKIQKIIESLHIFRKKE